MSDNLISDIRKAIELFEGKPTEVCGATQPHLVPPGAHGWTRCANCFNAVYAVQGDVHE